MHETVGELFKGGMRCIPYLIEMHFVGRNFNLCSFPCADMRLLQHKSVWLTNTGNKKTPQSSIPKLIDMRDDNNSSIT